MANGLSFQNPQSAFNGGYNWWVGTDGNAWANVEGLGVRNLGSYNPSGAGVAQTGLGYITLSNNTRINDPVNGANNTTPNNTGGGGSSSGSGGGSSAPAIDLDWYNALINSYTKQKDVAADNIRKQYGNSIDEMSVQRDNAVAGLDKEETDLNKGRSRSLSSLSNDLSKLLQNTGIQLGMFGAGNSSAAQATNYGATDLANKESSSINDDFNDQLGDISVLRKGYEDEYATKKKSLEGKMNNDLLTSNDKFTNTINDLRGDIVNKTDNKAVRQQQRDSILSAYNNFSAPAESLTMKDYNGAGVQNRGLSGTVNINNPNTPQSQYFSTVAAKKDDEKNKIA